MRFAVKLDTQPKNYCSPIWVQGLSKQSYVSVNWTFSKVGNCHNYTRIAERLHNKFSTFVEILSCRGSFFLLYFSCLASRKVCDFAVFVVFVRPCTGLAWFGALENGKFLQKRRKKRPCSSDVQQSKRYR